LVPSSRSAKRLVPAAYEAYLQGRYLWHRRGERDLDASIRSFETAIENDSDYAPAYAGLADVYLTLMDNGYIPLRDAVAKARPLALKALMLEDRKSTRLNSSHRTISYAVFCLKK